MSKESWKRTFLIGEGGELRCRIHVLRWRYGGADESRGAVREPNWYAAGIQIENFETADAAVGIGY